MPLTSITDEETTINSCPAAMGLKAEILEIKVILKEINARSIADHTELEKRSASINAIPELQMAYQRGKGAFWAFCVFVGICTYFIADIFTILKLKILGL